MSKQKWYIIKNTNTCEYWDGSSDIDCWTSNINFAYFFYDKNDAIHTKDVSWDKDKFNDDCQVIELCEDDEDYQELKEENKQLKQQLAEKDKYIDELEQEREFMLDEVKNRGTCGLCEKLENKEINELRDKLKEKDQEIERLKQCVMSREQVEAIMRPEISNLTKQLTKEITPIIYKECCHQICEKIREKLKKCVTPTCGTYIVYYEAKNVDDTLDQIEKGEEK